MGLFHKKSREKDSDASLEQYASDPDYLNALKELDSQYAGLHTGEIQAQINREDKQQFEEALRQAERRFPASMKESVERIVREDIIPKIRIYNSYEIYYTGEYQLSACIQPYKELIRHVINPMFRFYQSRCPGLSGMRIQVGEGSSPEDKSLDIIYYGGGLTDADMV